MAQWGIGMTWWHPIWTPPNPDEMRAGKAAIEKAMAMNAGSGRERGFITDVDESQLGHSESVDPDDVGDIADEGPGRRG